MTEGDLPGIDRPALERWFADRLGIGGPLAFTLIAGGHSNLTYRVDAADGAAFVLRRPPLGEIPAGAHDVAREHRLQAALAPTPVPVAGMLGLCTDAAVTGAPFYVMGWVSGTIVDRPARVAAALPTPADRATASLSLVDALAELHLVDHVAAGLGDLGSGEAFCHRVLASAKKKWDRTRTRDLPLIDSLHDRLLESIPQQRHTGLVHGDFRFGNVMLAGTRVAAVLDWELCAPGDVLLDIAYLLTNWTGPGDAAAETWMQPPPTVAGGFPPAATLAARYAERTGFDVGNLGYYCALSYWRNAVIAEGMKRRYMSSSMGGQTTDLDVLEARIRGRAELAARFLDS